MNIERFLHMPEGVEVPLPNRPDVAPARSAGTESPLAVPQAHFRRNPLDNPGVTIITNPDLESEPDQADTSEPGADSPPPPVPPGGGEPPRGPRDPDQPPEDSGEPEELERLRQERERLVREEEARIQRQLTPEERDKFLLLKDRERLLREHEEHIEGIRSGEAQEEDQSGRTRGLDPNLVQRIQSGEPAQIAEARDPNMSDADWAELQRRLREQEDRRREELQKEIERREESHDWNLEYEASPERGNQIAEEIIKWEAIRMIGKDQFGNETPMDWDWLNKAYLNQEIHTEAIRLRGVIIHGLEIKDRSQLLVKPLEAVDRANLRYLEPLLGTEMPLDSVQSLITAYESGAYLRDQDRFNTHVAKYFKEARRTGLLKSLDTTLSGIYKREIKDGIKDKVSSTEVMRGDRRGVEGVEQKVQAALDSWENLCRARMRTNPDIKLLFVTDPRTNELVLDPRTGRARGVADLYAQLALERFTLAIDNGDYEGLNQGPYIAEAGEIQEFELGQIEEEEESEENYWEIEWGRYPKINAQTVEQYGIAADTYLARLQSVSTSPNELLQGSREFVEAIIRSKGFEKVQKESPGFVIKLTNQIRARVGVFGADHTFELYEPKEAKQYLDYTNEDGAGPERYLELVKAYEAMVMATVREVDTNPMWDILFSFHGSRGQIARNFTAQRNREGQGLYNLAYQALIDQMMGVQIINLEQNLDNVTKQLSDRRFNQMFDGLYRYGHVPEGREMGDTHTYAYQEFIRSYPEKADQEARRRELSSEEWNSVELGRIQLRIKELKEGVRAGIGEPLERGKTVIDRLDPRDQVRYKRARERAEKFVEIAMQLYGAFGEKAKRGGGIFTIRRKDEDGNITHEDFMPVHYAEKWIQCGETLTKMKYADDAAIWNGYKTWTDPIATKIRNDNLANKNNEFKNFKAQYRTAVVAKVRGMNIAELRKNGYDAKLRYADGTEMKLKRPKENPNADEEDRKDDGLLKDINGNTIAEEVEIDFYTATHHPYGDFDPNTYWGYQDEHRAILLNPTTLAIAKDVRDGLIRWEDADATAIQLLKLDPTLCRVRALKGSGFVEREGKLVMAAVGESTISRLRIRQDLYGVFFPRLGTPKEGTDEYFGVYYGLQDFGGFLKMTQHHRARFAENPERFMRRGRRLLPFLDNSMEALSDYWGRGGLGVTGVINAMDNPLQRIGGTFALGKYGAFVELSNRQYEALVEGKDQEGNLKEGLLLKLTNESDMHSMPLEKNLPPLGVSWDEPDRQQDYLEHYRKSLNRLETYDRLKSLESSIKNAQGMIFIEDVDILADNKELDPALIVTLDALPNITGANPKVGDLARYLTEAKEIDYRIELAVDSMFNTDQIDEGTISVETGLGRYLAKGFNRHFFALLRNEEKRGGVPLYVGEKEFYAHGRDKIIFYSSTYPGRNKKTGIVQTNTTVEEWFDGKAIPT